MLQTLTKVSSEPTMKIEFQSFSTWHDHPTKHMYKLGPNALSLLCTMAMEAIHALTFFETIFINWSLEMTHFLKTQKMLSETGLQKLKRCFWIWSIKSTRVNETEQLTISIKVDLAQSLVWLSMIWSILLMLEIQERLWVLREETKFMLSQEITDQMMILRKWESSKTEAKFIKRKRWLKSLLLAESEFKAHTWWGPIEFCQDDYQCLELLETLKRSTSNMEGTQMLLLRYQTLRLSKSRTSMISFCLDAMEFSTNYQTESA